MTTFRGRLRLWATIWLVFQAMSLCALVPRDCCAAHRPVSDHAGHRCDEAAASARCPMRAPDGSACPMHRRPASAAGQQAPNAACTIRGTCGGPPLLMLLATPGILAESAAALPDFETPLPATEPRQHTVGRFQPPDPPPPRA